MSGSMVKARNRLGGRTPRLDSYIRQYFSFVTFPSYKHTYLSLNTGYQSLVCPPAALNPGTSKDRSPHGRRWQCGLQASILPAVQAHNRTSNIKHRTCNSPDGGIVIFSRIMDMKKKEAKGYYLSLLCWNRLCEGTGLPCCFLLFLLPSLGIPHGTEFCGVAGGVLQATVQIPRGKDGRVGLSI